MDPIPDRQRSSAATTRGTRPSVLSHLLHDRGVHFAAGLAVLVAIPMVVLFYFQFRSMSDLEHTSSVVLRQLSSDTADGLARTVEEALKRPHIGVLLAIPQARTEPINLRYVDPIFEEGLKESPFVESFCIWSEAASPLANQWLVFNHDSLNQPAGGADRFHEDQVMGEILLARFQSTVQYRRAIVAFTATIRGRQKYVQGQLRFSSPSRSRLSSVVALVVDAEQLRTQYLPGLVRRRLAALEGPTGFPALQARLIDDAGVTLVGMDGGRDRFVDERTFPLVFFDKELMEYTAPYEQHREIWRLHTGYGDETIPEIVGANTRPQMALMIVLALVMGGGVFLVAGAAAREVRLAELKTNFVASISHDLKTPLALIQLFAETLELGRVRNPERAVEYYRIINSEARKLTRVIENMLDFSKMEAGLRPYRMALTDMGSLASDVLERMANQFTQNQFRVTTEVEPDLPLVHADGDAVEQAVENLLSNAMKYSGEVRDIEVGVERRDGHVVISVTDHGLGIPRREQQKIFRKFYRIESELGGGPQGCGLGLAIVDHTMRGHGGFVRVESEPDHGSTFSLHFPIPADAAMDGAMHEAHSGDRGRAADAARSA